MENIVASQIREHHGSGQNSALPGIAADLLRTAAFCSSAKPKQALRIGTSSHARLFDRKMRLRLQHA
jgi:hypothetical protein